LAIEKILVPVDFSPCSDAALDHALSVADVCGAEVEVLYVSCPRGGTTAIEVFADTPEGIAMEARLSAAEWKHPARVSGRLEFGEEPARVILALLEREHFDLVIMGAGAVAESVARTSSCRVVTRSAPNENEAA
jgi:universal stress protein A